MTIGELIRSVAPAALGREAHALVSELYPICRSITGQGFRDSLDVLRKHIPIESTNVPSGTDVFDWTIPNEWNIRAAWIKTASGRTVVDFANHSLHAVSYSAPVRAQLSLAELKSHLHSLPDQPDLIPYRTTYYSPSWGFCLPHRLLETLRESDGPFDVVIDSTLAPGNLTWGEAYLPGETSDEVLISCHSCHPSLANDNCSSMALATHVARLLADVSRRYSYRFLFAPGTIGAIAWLARRQQSVSNIKHGLVCACLGDPGQSTYKQSRRGVADIDRVVERVLHESGQPYAVEPFSPYGYDERQFCSPGFNLPVGCLMRTPPGKFAEYHTSADDLNFVTAEMLGDSAQKLLNVIHVLETNRTYVNQKPFCEPRLGKRGLYSATGGAGPGDAQLAMLWVLNQSDGTNDLLSIAQRSGLPYSLIQNAAERLATTDLLTPVN